MGHATPDTPQSRQCLVWTTWNSDLHLGYISFSNKDEKVAHTVSVEGPCGDSDVINLDFGEDGRVVGIEFYTQADTFPELIEGVGLFPDEGVGGPRLG